MVDAANPVTTPAKLPVPRSFARTGSVGQRTLKMIASRCPTCQAGKNVPWNWWESCPHDRYFTAIPKETVKPTYEDELDPDGQPTGRKRIVGQETVVEWVPMPNWKEVAVAPRINQGRGYHRNRSKGAIMPEEFVKLYPTLWPNATGFVCQYRGCFEQDGLVTYETGVFHDKREAQLVWYDQEGKVLEYNNESDPDSARKRNEMLSRAPI